MFKYTGEQRIREERCSAAVRKGALRCPRHKRAVAGDMSILQLLYSHDRGKLPHVRRQGLLLSCKKNVTRKQPKTRQNPLIFSLVYFLLYPSLPQKVSLEHYHYTWPSNQMSTFPVRIYLIYRPPEKINWSANDVSVSAFTCDETPSLKRIHEAESSASAVFTPEALKKRSTQPEGRLHTAPPSQLLIYIIRLRDSQLHFPAIIRVVTRRAGAGNGAMVGPSSQKWDWREKPAGEKGLHWEKVGS